MKKAERAQYSSGFLRAGEFGFELFDAREDRGELRWQGLGQFVIGDADGFIDIAEGVFSEDAVLGLAENETEGGAVGGMAELVVDDGAIEIHLADVFRLEVAAFEFDDDEAAELEVIEEQVEVEIFVADGEVVLAADEGEAAAELDEEFLDMGEQAGFEFAFMEGFIEREEIEEVGVFEEALSEAGVGGGERLGEIIDGAALAFMEAVFDL